jgi:hypothetical protein
VAAIVLNITSKETLIYTKGNVNEKKRTLTKWHYKAEIIPQLI